MGYDENAKYFERMFPYAKRASEGTGIPISFILTQWGHETGYGTSNFAVNGNNHGGINYYEGSNAIGTMDGRHSKYASIDQFVDDYIHVMSNDRYAGVRSAGSPDVALNAIGTTGYAEDPNYVGKLKEIFDVYGLRGYDTWQGGGSAGGTVTLPKIDGKLAAVAGALLVAYAAVAAIKD